MKFFPANRTSSKHVDALRTNVDFGFLTTELIEIVLCRDLVVNVDVCAVSKRLRDSKPACFYHYGALEYFLQGFVDWKRGLLVGVVWRRGVEVNAILCGIR